MSLFSDILNKRKNESGNKTPDPGVKTTSGADPIIDALITGFGTLITGLGNINNGQTLKQGAKSKGLPKKENNGLLGLLSRQLDQTEIIIGGQTKDFYNKYYTLINENQTFLKNNILKNEFVDNVKRIPKILENVDKSINTIVSSLSKEKSVQSKTNNEVNIKGGNDFALILTAVKNFDIDENTKKSLETLSKMTSPGGAIDEIFTNIETLNNKNVDVNKFVDQLTKINEVSSESAAIEGKVNAQKIENSVKVMESVSRLMSSLIGVGILLVVVGLLSSKIDFVGILKFSGVLLLFLTGIMTVYVLASVALRKDGPVFKGMENFTNLVAVSAAIMLFGALVTRWISIGDLISFTTMLSLFLWGIIGVISNFADVFNKEHLGKTLKAIPAIIITCTVVMLLGSFAIEYINIGNLIKFTFTLGLFLFTILGVLALVSRLYKGEGAKGMKDALIIIVGSAFLMFLGAAVIPALNIKNLALFTLTLGLFLLVTLGVLALVGWLWKKSGAKDMGTAMLVVVGAAFLMFLGAAIYPKVDKVALLLFTLTLSGFLVAIILPFRLISRQLRRAEKVLLRMIIFVGLSATILMIGGFLFMKYPKLQVTVPLFGTILGLFILAMTGIIWLLSKIDSANLTKATLALVGVSGCLVIISGAFLILTEVSKRIDGIGGMVKFIALVGGAMTVLGLLTAGIVALGLALGAPPMNVFATVAIGVVLAAASAFAIVAVGFLGIATALEKLSQIKSFDVSPLIEGVGSLTLLMYAMAPLIPMAPFLLMVEAVMFNLTLIISKMAETVKDYADLKIAIYEGTKVVGYRHLDTSDFQSASDNISLIVTTLTEGIMKAYEAHPEWYGGNVSPLWALAGPWGLIGAAIQGTQKSPLEKVISQSKLLAPLIAQIAEAVKDYADLKIKVYQGTKHVGYRHLDTSDFVAASNNIALLINTLTEGIMKAYEAHPDWYNVNINALWALGGPIGLAIGAFTSSTPLEKVISQSKMLAPLISKIGSAVGDIANLKMATKWDNNGNATDYKSLTEQDFKNAAKNVSKVITVLTKSIMNVYEKHKEWYEDGDDSPIINVINTNKKLSELISDVASSIKDYADLKMPVDWKDGKPSNFKSMKEEDFKNAGANVGLVLNTLGLSLMSVYEEHKDWYEDGWIDDSPFVTVIDTNTKLSKLISSVASSVKDYADLRMPDYNAEWKDGKPTKYTKMEPGDFAAAGMSIGLVVTTTAMGLMGYVPKINGEKLDWEPGGAKQIIDDYILSDNDDKYEAFNRVLDTSVKIGTVVSSLANGISNFSKMMFPDYTDGIDERGNPKKGYKELNSKDFTEAANCITTVITTVATALIKVVNDDKALPEGQRMWNIDDDFEESPLFKILSASEKMGSTISNIASGLAEYANMKFATGYDKDGKATGYQRLSEGDLKRASEKITDVITLISGTMMGIYEAGYDGDGNKNSENKGKNKGKNIWDIETNWLGQPKGELSPIERVINASSVMASMIESMAKGIVLFAGGNMGTEDKPVIINGTTLKLAKESITDVLKNSAETIANMAKNSPTKELFENKNLNLIISSLSRVNKVIIGAGTAVQKFAALSIPTDWDENGVPKDFKKMEKTDFDEAQINIIKIITAIGAAFNRVVQDSNNSWLQDIDDSSFSGIANFGRELLGGKRKTSSSTIGIIMNSIMKMALTLSIMSGCIYGYATMRFPMGVNNEGHVEYSEPLNFTDIELAKLHIVKVINTLGETMMLSTKNETFKYLTGDGKEMLNNLGDYVSSITDTITTISESVTELVKSDTLKNLGSVVTTLEGIIQPISDIINNIGQLLDIIFGDRDRIANVSIKFAGRDFAAISFAKLINAYGDIYEKTSQNFDSFIDAIISIVEKFSTLKDPFVNSQTKINLLYKLFTEDQYITKIHTVIGSIGQLLYDMKQISLFDNIFTEEEGLSSVLSNYTNMFKSQSEISAENKERAQSEIDNIVDRLNIYSELIVRVTYTLKIINDAVSNIKLANYSDFNESVLGFFNAIATVKHAMGDTTKEEAENISIIIKSYSSALDSLIGTSSHADGLKNFGGHVNQLDKFVKTVNSIKLSNLFNLNKFVNSLNQLAQRMGNLDRLTDAIANKLSKVLEKLVERLVHAETTIVKADEIQKRRHELINRAVEEVKILMQQPMTVEVQQVGGGTVDDTGGGGGDNGAAGGGSGDQANKQSGQTPTK